MLKAAGVHYEAVSPGVDEAMLKGSSDARSTARLLAEAKALAVSERRGADWVVGSDSIVSVDGELFDKPRDRDEAANHLRFFSGKPMALTSAVALAKGGDVDWSVSDSATLQVRILGEDFIEAYLQAEWPEVGYCVGVFRLEERGVQLFDSIEGSHFTILGMPLLPLLGALRARGLLQS